MFFLYSIFFCGGNLHVMKSNQQSVVLSIETACFLLFHNTIYLGRIINNHQPNARALVSLGVNKPKSKLRNKFNPASSNIFQIPFYGRFTTQIFDAGRKPRFRRNVCNNRQYFRVFSLQLELVASNNPKFQDHALSTTKTIAPGHFESNLIAVNISWGLVLL